MDQVVHFVEAHLGGDGGLEIFRIGCENFECLLKILPVGGGAGNEGLLLDARLVDVHDARLVELGHQCHRAALACHAETLVDDFDRVGGDEGHVNTAPRGTKGACEFLVVFIYDGVIKSTLKDKAKRFAPFLLTVFMFIFVMNLLGLIVIFPGGANLTGNIAVTLTMAILTFLVTNIFGTKHYWKDIFWPDVPLWLKFPIPIMPLIELFGIFTKPAALTVRLFANMMGGHMIVIVLTLLIFIFASVISVAVGGATAIISILFSVFMLLIDVLVSFIQAYVFTMLSTIFISLAQEEGHKDHDKKDHVEKQHIATNETN